MAAARSQRALAETVARRSDEPALDAAVVACGGGDRAARLRHRARQPGRGRAVVGGTDGRAAGSGGRAACRGPGRRRRRRSACGAVRGWRSGGDRRAGRARPGALRGRRLGRRTLRPRRRSGAPGGRSPRVAAPACGRIRAARRHPPATRHARRTLVGGSRRGDGSRGRSRWAAGGCCSGCGHAAPPRRAPCRGTPSRRPRRARCATGESRCPRHGEALCPAGVGACARRCSCSRKPRTAARPVSASYWLITATGRRLTSFATPAEPGVTGARRRTSSPPPKPMASG